MKGQLQKGVCVCMSACGSGLTTFDFFCYQYTDQDKLLILSLPHRNRKYVFACWPGVLCLPFFILKGFGLKPPKTALDYSHGLAARR